MVEIANANCHVSTLMIKLLTIVFPRYRPHNITKYTNAKI
jgi:hypothetical protein